MRIFLLFILTVFTVIQGFGQRTDGAIKVNVSTSAYSGSLQNGSWSPDNKFLLCTNWGGGYNKAPANVDVIDLSNYSLRKLTTDGLANCNMPGSTWNAPTNKVIFSADHTNGDQVHTMLATGAPGSAVKITPFTDRVCWEPGFSPSGKWIVYEAHYNSSPNNGVIEIYKADGTQGPITLTSKTADCRQPSWSPKGDKICYQRVISNAWDCWTMDTTGTNQINRTSSDAGDQTDVSFSPDGQWIIFSTDLTTLNNANVYVKNLNTNQLV